MTRKPKTLSDFTFNLITGFLVPAGLLIVLYRVGCTRSELLAFTALNLAIQFWAIYSYRTRRRILPRWFDLAMTNFFVRLGI